MNLVDPICEEFEVERRAVMERIATETDGVIELDFEGEVIISPAGGLSRQPSGSKSGEPSLSLRSTKSEQLGLTGASGQPTAGPSKLVDKSEWEGFVDPVEVPLPELAGFDIECGCCFGEYDFGEMIQCPEAHLFCKECARRNAEESIGNDKPVVRCMDQSSKLIAPPTQVAY